MITFKQNPKTFEIGEIKIGGRIGVNPTVMIGSIFYKRDPLITNSKTGEFSIAAANALIEEVEEVSERTGVPFMLDVVCSIDERVEDYLGWAADATSNPLLIDAVSNEAALRGLEYVREQGILSRTVFNSLNKATSSLIYDKISEIGLESAIILTYSNEAAASSTERVKLLETLLPRARSAGISKPLIDTFVMDVPTLGLACKALIEVKSKYGLPVGCGAHNASGAWRQLKKQRDVQITTACSTVIDTLPAALGADYIIYGPLSMASYLFPAVGVIDTAYGQVALEDKKELAMSHPRFKLASSLKEEKSVHYEPSFRYGELGELVESLRNRDAEGAVKAAEKALERGVDPVTIIERGITRELREIGERYGRGDIWFIDLVFAADTAQSAMKVIRPMIEKSGRERESVGKYLIGTVAGDIHDIGKNIVGMLLQASGFEVIDLGVDVSAEKFVEAVREHRPDVLGMSALLTSTVKEQRKVIEALEESGLRGDLRIIVGGAAASEELAREIGADAYAEDALDGVRKGLSLMEKSGRPGKPI